MTITEGGSVLFIDGSARQAAGSTVQFVLWFNFLSGFAFIGVGAGRLTQKNWVRRLARTVAVISVVVLAAFFAYIALGGVYEKRTLVAMPMRTAIWVSLALWAGRKTF